MIKMLDVWLFSDCAGTLALNSGQLSFTYSHEWLATDHAKPLSCSLPLQTTTFNDQIARPFFAGLLPEGQMRQLLSKQYAISEHNDFALLNEIGGECAGAVTFIEHGTKLTRSEYDDSDVQWLSNEELIKVCLLYTSPSPRDS